MARLLILWLLSERSLHGYQIKKSLTDDGMGFWFGLEDASIYSVLRTLAKNGYATALAEQDGNRPQRTRYAITTAGRKYYQQLLREAWATSPLPIAAFDVALAATADLTSKELKTAKAARKTALETLLRDIERNRRAAPADAIVNRNEALVRAELGWLATFEKGAP